MKRPAGPDGRLRPGVFRSFTGAAPLKQVRAASSNIPVERLPLLHRSGPIEAPVSIDCLVRYEEVFRSFTGAAPLKRDPPPTRDRPPHRLPLLHRSGPIEAAERRGLDVPGPRLPLLHRSGPIEESSFTGDLRFSRASLPLLHRSGPIEDEVVAEKATVGEVVFRSFTGAAPLKTDDRRRRECRSECLPLLHRSGPIEDRIGQSA